MWLAHCKLDMTSHWCIVNEHLDDILQQIKGKQPATLKIQRSEYRESVWMKTQSDFSPKRTRRHKCGYRRTKSSVKPLYTFSVQYLHRHLYAVLSRSRCVLNWCRSFIDLHVICAARPCHEHLNEWGATILQHNSKVSIRFIFSSSPYWASYSVSGNSLCLSQQPNFRTWPYKKRCSRQRGTTCEIMW